MTRVWWTVAGCIASCSGLLGLLFVLALPSLAALPAAELRWQRLAAALIAGLAALVVVAWRRRQLWEGGPVSLVYLPAQLTLTFGSVGAIALPLGAYVGGDPLLAQRPAVLLLGGPALTLAIGLLLHSLIRPALVAGIGKVAVEAKRDRQLGPQPDASGGWRWWGALAMRRALFIATLAVAGVALTLAGVHTHSQLQTIEEAAQRQHLDTLAAVLRTQLAGLSRSRRAAFFRGFPGDARSGTALEARADGSVVFAAMPAFVGHRVVPQSRPGHCTIDARRGASRSKIDGSRWQCARRALPAGHLVMLLADTPVPRQAGTAVSLGLGLLLLTAMIGLLIGRDAARDIVQVTAQLDAMAAAGRVDIGAAIPVASLDEVGVLVSAVSKLRRRLGVDMETYAGSLQRAREAENVQNQFIADVSHELRTPLNTLCGYSQLLLEGIEGELTPAQREDVRVIYKGSRQLLGLINDILDMSVMESGRLNLSLEDVDLGPLCHDMLSLQEVVLRAGKNVKVELVAEINGDLPLLRADPARISQVIQNLLSNAIKFTRRGKIYLRARREGLEAQVRIEVEDTGQGISAVDLPAIFEEYRQAGNIRARRGGTGLGLAICRRLVELHGGTVEVESEIGRGSKFAVLLPIAGPEAVADD